jgi:hypothetical protein
MLIAFFIYNNVNAQSFSIVENISGYSAGDDVEFSVSESGIDFEKSHIVWSLGTRNILSGFGEKSVKIVIPKEESSLNVGITTVKGEKYNSSFRIYTKEVVMYYEATDSYTPSWYSGKKMLAKGGSARVHAFPNITNRGLKIKDSDMYFTWEINGEINKNYSGYGKSYVDVNALEISDDNIEVGVSVKPRLSNEEVRSVINVPITNTEVLIYKKIGDSKRALFGTNKFSSDDFILVAEPYFFSLDKKYNFYWTVGNRVEKGFSEKGFKVSKAGTFSNIKVKVEHVKKIFQEAESELTASF